MLFRSLQERQVRVHGLGGLVPITQVAGAGFDENGVEFQEIFAGGKVVQFYRQSGEFRAIVAGCYFVEQLAQAINVRLARAGTFRRNVALGADIGIGLTLLGHQADIRQLGDTVHKNDVGRLDIAVNQAVLVQMPERPKAEESAPVKPKGKGKAKGVAP